MRSDIDNLLMLSKVKEKLKTDYSNCYLTDEEKKSLLYILKNKGLSKYKAQKRLEKMELNLQELHQKTITLK